MEQFDDAVVGAGILGLAHAYHLTKRGRKVVVFERGPRAAGASVRNFGMIWPIGQSAGPNHALARRSAALWREVLDAAGLWYAPIGSLHLAYHDDEAAVLAEFTQAAPALGYDAVSLLDPAEVLARSAAVVSDGLVAGMFSGTEINVDPRQVLGALPGFLTERHGVRFVWETTVTGYERPVVRAGTACWGADHLYVCAGADLQTLYPEALGALGLVLCKLQMLRASPPSHDWQLGPMLAAGLTLQHYKAFAACPSLPALKDRFAEEMPDHNRHGIHVMASQNSTGDLILGDSHLYGPDALDPFDSEEIDRLILDYLGSFLRLPSPPRLTARWNGVYAKHPTLPYAVVRPEPGVIGITGVGGAGMTLSFGLAEQVIGEADA